MKERPLKPRVTIRDVAAAAGVSITTVSHVLNGKGRTSEETRRLVLAAAERVGYGADPIARSLRTGETGVLGIIFRPSDAISGSMHGTEYHIRLAGGAATAALSRGYGLLHLPRPMGTQRYAFPMDGCIVVAPFKGDPIVTEFIRRNLPVVTADPDPGRPEFPWSIRRDDYTAVRELLDHLAANGAERIALLHGLDTNAWLLESRRAFMEWAAEHRREPMVFTLPEPHGAEGAHKLALELLSEKSRPDTIVAATTRFAVGVMQASRELGLAVPQDLMVAALSDSELARGHETPITAIDLHGDVVGRESVALIMRRLAGESPPEPAILRPTLRLRESTRRR
ncbi:MAG: LacI family DNA-binding transcriptional regulator [Variibacter sp.]|nr:LacI family DNA-binding transcriptional regulator [Variibacter sp.]